MARGGNREGSQGKILANAAVGAAPKVNFDGGYGDDVAQAPLQANRQAPRPTPSPTSQQGGGSSRPLIPLDAPSMRADEPVTAGAPIGPGPGPEALGLDVGNLGALEKLRPQLPVLERLADMPGSSNEMRALVRRLRGALGT